MPLEQDVEQLKGPVRTVYAWQFAFENLGPVAMTIRDDQVNSWGLPCGRLGSIQLVVGWSYLAAGVVLVGGGCYLRGRPGNDDLPVLAVTVWATLAMIGLLQDLVHATAASLLGGRGRSIVLAAHGGSGQYEIAPGVRQVIVAAASPLLSIALALFLARQLANAMGADFWGLLNPLQPPELKGELTRQALIKVGIWVSMASALVQMLPVWGCDGRSILSGLVAMRAKHAGEEAVETKVSFVTRLLAMAAILLACCAAAFESGQRSVPIWPFVAISGVMMWISGRRSDPRSLSADPRKSIGWLGWFQIRRALTMERQEADDVARLDEVLERLHEDGMDSLSVSEKALLKRVSKNLKQRRP